MFHRELPDGRAGASIRLETTALHAATTTAAVYDLPYADCAIRIGGASGRMVFCRSVERGLTITCDDRRFEAALREAAGGRLDERIDAARVEARAADGGSRRLMLGLAVGTLVLAVAVWFGVLAAGRAAITVAPPELDRRIGALAYEQMDLQGPVVEDPRIVAPLESLVDRLVAADPDDPFDYRLSVVDADITNAFAFPGGRIVLYTGLLDAAETPEQVAGVLAHEMAHITERHGMRGIARSIGLVVAVQVLTGDAGGFVALAAEFGRFAAENTYSREQEADSDRLGVARLHTAGIDPTGLAGFFELLEAEEAGVSVPAWMNTHPDHSARIAAIREQVEDLPPAEYQPAISPHDWAALQAALEDGPAPTPIPTEENPDGRDGR